MEIFDEILAKDKLDKVDLELIIEKITVYEDHIEIQLKADIAQLLRCGTIPEETAANFKQDTGHISQIAQSSQNRPDKVFRVSVICNGAPLLMSEILLRDAGAGETDGAEIVHSDAGNAFDRWDTVVIREGSTA